MSPRPLKRSKQVRASFSNWKKKTGRDNRKSRSVLLLSSLLINSLALLRLNPLS
jgi:hypothetical protein